MDAAGEGRQQLDAASVLNAKQTLLQFLGRAGIGPGDAAELIGLVEAGALAGAHEDVGAVGRNAPVEKGELYASGWLDGAQAVVDELHGLAGRALRQAVASPPPDAPAPAPRPVVTRMQVERAKVAVLPLYRSFAADSDLDPDVTGQVLTAVLATMDSGRRAAYAGRLAAFVSEHRGRLERLFAEYGPGSDIPIHGRHSLLHSPTSVAVLERLTTTPSAFTRAWDAAELPPAWLEGLTTAWEALAPA
ncbi:hypothetical protein ACWC10_25855 [Streptomyces sp. NPDC001595]|uniref:hypothetical protein n=1 Tax=Streptomyces sp. NPDC001532 TaxID=3154520 RepID=UPI00332CBAF7